MSQTPPDDIHGPRTSRSAPTADAFIPPNQGKPKRNMLPLVAAGAGALVLLIVGVVVVWKIKSGSHPRLPIDAKRLPSQTQELYDELVESSREKDPRIKRAYLAAEMGASFCRPESSNPAHQLERIGMWGSTSARTFFGAKHLAEVQELLECGNYLGASLDSNYITGLTVVEDEKTRHRIGIASLKVTELPANLGYIKHVFNGIDGFCRVPKDDPSKKPDMNPNGTAKPTTAAAPQQKDDPAQDCKDGYYAGVHEKYLWFMGKKPGVDAIAKSLSSPREELSLSVAALQDAASMTEGLPARHIQAQLKTSKPFLMAPCSWASSQSAGKSSDFMDACFPKTIDKDIEALDSKLRAAAYEMDNDVAKAGNVHGNIVLVARDADAAKDVEKEANDIVREWKSHIENNEPKIIKLAKSDASSRREHDWVAICDTFTRALRRMKVERSGRSVKITFDEKLSSEDRNELKESEEKTVETRNAVTDILDAIQTKKPIPVASLAKLVGPKWAEFLIKPTVQLDEADCKAIKAKLADVKSTDLATSEQRSLYYQYKWNDCSKKIDVSEAQKQCLVEFKDAVGFGACVQPGGEPAESDFGTGKKKEQ